MKHHCLCLCHAAPDERFRSDGADVYDAIAAATACDTCRHVHCLAMLATDLPCETPSAAQLRCGVRTPGGPTVRTDNGEANPYLPPRRWIGEDGG